MEGGGAQLHKHILVIDDDENTQRALKFFLNSRGYEITGVADGKEGLERFLECKPDLVLCDVRLPGMSGFEILSDIRSFALGRETPVVLMSAYYKEGIQIDPDSFYTADEYLHKPLSSDHLLTTIHKLLSKGRSHSREAYRKALVRTGIDSGVPTDGSIEDRPFAALLRALVSRNETGVLKVSYESVVRYVVFENGAPVYACLAPNLGELAAVVRYQQHTDLARSTEETLLAAFAQQQGDYLYTHFKALPRYIPRIVIDVNELTIKGISRYYDWEKLQEWFQITGNWQTAVTPAAWLEKNPGLGQTEWKILKACDNTQVNRVLAKFNGKRQKALQTIYAFYITGVLTRRNN